MFAFTRSTKPVPMLVPRVRQEVTRKDQLFMEELEKRDVPATITYSEGAIIGGQSYQHLGLGLRQFDPNLNDGATDLIRVGSGRHGPEGQQATNASLRGALGFTLADIPIGARIVSASLTMTIESYGDAGTNPPNVEVHEFAGTTLNEATSTWNSTGGGAFRADILTSASGLTSGSMAFTSTSLFVAAAQRALDSNQSLQLILVAPVAEA